MFYTFSPIFLRVIFDEMLPYKQLIKTLISDRAAILLIVKIWPHSTKHFKINLYSQGKFRHKGTQIMSQSQKSQYLRKNKTH